MSPTDAAGSKVCPEKAAESTSPGDLGRPPKVTSVGVYLRPITPPWRGKIKKLYKERGGREDKQFNNRHRALLSECIFEVANDLEHRHANSVNEPQSVGLIFDAMNRVYDDLGWNE
jgi:hypothetical protein